MDGSFRRESLGGTLDFKDVEHLTAVTPLARRDGHGRHQQQNDEDDVRHDAPPTKRSRANEVDVPSKLASEGSASSSPQSSTDGHPTSHAQLEHKGNQHGGSKQEDAKKSVRYPRINYATALPSAHEYLQANNGVEELALLSLLRDLMASDVVEVSKMLIDTKFHYLGGEMGKFSEAVISPLVAEMTECVQREQRVKEELEVEKREAQAELEEVQGLQALVERLKDQEAKWMELAKNPAVTMNGHAEEEDEGEVGEGVEGSEVLRKAKQVLESSPKQIKAAVTGTVTQVGYLEDLVEGIQECLDNAQEKQKRLFQEYQKAAAAPYPDVHAPKAIVHKMTQ